MIEENDAIKRQLETRAMREYHEHIGKAILADCVYGYRDEDYFDTPLSKPALVRVAPTAEADIVRWCDGHIDPYWDVELLVPHRELVGVTNLWIDGTSHCIDGSSEPNPWVVVSNVRSAQARIESTIIRGRLWLSAHIGRLQDAIYPFEGGTP
jgi:hypothetical protein